MRTVRCIVRGRVQGVGFRAWTVGEARRLGLAGTVRNRRDGSVEVLAHGDVAAIATLLAALRHGPAGAAVTSVEEDEADGGADLEAGGFWQAPTV